VQLESKGCELESTSLSLTEELQAMSRKLAQAESAAKSHEREVERLGKVAEDQREVAADRIIKLSEAEAFAKRLEGECASLRVKIVQMEAAIKVCECMIIDSPDYCNYRLKCWRYK
jgi:chromosome segregation ATPase